MESEQSQNFNERLSQWVANQGFWFQIRYSMSGSGSKGTAMFHLLRLVFRLSLFLLVVAVGGWIYLLKYTDSAKFKDALEASIKSGLVASEASMSGFSRGQGQLLINQISAKGGSDTFFSSLEARNIRCKMGLLGGIAGQWDTGIMAISSLHLDLRAGADDSDSAVRIADAIFDRSSKVKVNTVEVAEASLDWGYSDRTRGAVEKSAMRIQRLDNGMKLTFRGGTFSQNWLRKLEIVEMVVNCDRAGITFEKAEFRRGQGSVIFTGLTVTGGERPLVNGTAKIRKLGLGDSLPVALSNFVEGSISGNFAVSGSTNSSEGVIFAGQVRLDGQDEIALRDSIYLLKALSMVDYVRNYHRVDFREGSFRMRTAGGGIELTDIDLKSGDVFTLSGKLLGRMPTPEEARQAPEAVLPKGDSEIGLPMYNGDDLDVSPVETKEEDSDFSLRRAALEAKRAKEGAGGQEASSASDRALLNLEEQQLQAQASERAARTLRYEGQLRITIPPDAFERAPRLQSQFPVDPSGDKISLTVPIQGTLYSLTFDQGEEILKGRR